MRISVKAVEIAENVVRNIKGRAADGGISLPFVAAMIELAPDGDHVDIGTLFGASAIAAALMKKELGHTGKVYCIDPYNKEKRKEQALPMHDLPEELLSGSPEELMANAEHFGVELTLIQKESYPWPEELETAVFATAYVDGEHQAPVPWNDFESLRGRVTDYIAFDNFEEEYPAVVEAVLKASDEEDWFLYYKNYGFAALRRILPNRSSPTDPYLMKAI